MIALLRGVVESIGLDQVVVSAGGVGFGGRVTPVHAQSLARGDEAVVHTATVVREDSLTLYGFASADERDVFERLMGVTGIGPKTALAAAPAGEVEAEVRAALVGLGWSEAQAAKAVDALSGQGLGASDMLRSALVSLGGGRG